MGEKLLEDQISVSGWSQGEFPISFSEASLLNLFQCLFSSTQVTQLLLGLLRYLDKSHLDRGRHEWGTVFGLKLAAA